ncbi:exodeoxyribonuclease V subunit alpha [Antrihabitans cavernicola]|uniref:RecBCD enzyme subunit RecD n=1 Tax=Antrihabitans cavernicola TaxID=2495913 RepID=A0A5A7S8H0_9NOCA|nr:exodeoxyribonuclease V subunit alpha [Spelaeibacter cavernicola]KAA0020076.1 exodeoxyribonuclease V subunit alpha [Spelaeibacter cavernicola]
MTQAHLVQRATGLLRTFNEAGVLAAADVHVALRLAKLTGEDSEPVLLATAMTVRAVRAGSVCLDLRRLRDVTIDEESGVDDDQVDLSTLPWPELDDVIAALRKSRLVIGGPAGPLRPLRLVDTAEGELLYLDRYFRQEQTIRHALDARASVQPTVDARVVYEKLAELFVDPSGTQTSAPDRQRIAAAVAATRWTTVIAGGPGTGKTHTIARILALLVAEHGSHVRIGLAAPTGKAAARLQESVSDQAAELTLPHGVTAMTLHRLLGWQRGSNSRFRHNASNRLPYDVIVVDETSMVSLTMMCRLLEAVRPDARLVLVGDPDQLTSVDAGAVLADLVARPVAEAANATLGALVGSDVAALDDPHSLTDDERDRLRGGVIRLTRGRRFGGAIEELAAAVRGGDEDRVIDLLRSGSPETSFHSPDDLTALHDDVVATASAVADAAAVGDVDGALRSLESHRLLCAHRDGPFGVQRWAQRAREWVGTSRGEWLDPANWYPGQPLLVTANDHETRIYNGDTGVIVDRGDGTLMAAFQRGSEPYLLYPSQLSAVQTVYAMTIHRSQGSQYDAVSVLLPARASSLLTRELLYTAITRARNHVRIVGSEEAVRVGVTRQVLRASGLRRTFL